MAKSVVPKPRVSRVKLHKLNTSEISIDKDLRKAFRTKKRK